MRTGCAQFATYVALPPSTRHTLPCDGTPPPPHATPSARHTEQSACQFIKQQLDKKQGATWHVVMGEGIAAEVTYQTRCLMHLYYGKVGVIAFKC